MQNQICYYIGLALSEALQKGLENKGYSLRSFTDFDSLNRATEEVVPYFCILDIDYVSPHNIEDLRSTGIPSIVVTHDSLGLSGLDFIKNGALDYLQISDENFVDNCLESLDKFLHKNSGGFIHKVLRESEKLYFSIINSSPVSILVCSTEGNIIISNQEAMRFLELAEEDNVLNHIDSVLKDEFKENMMSVYYNNKVKTFQCGIEVEGGVNIPVRWQMSKFEHALPGTILIYGEDITDIENIRKKELYKAKSLISMNERLTRANKSLDQFSSMISHDLKNGLNRIQGFVRVLERKESLNMSTEGKDLIERVNQSTSDMVETINRILDFAKSKGSDIEVRSFSMNKLLEKLIFDFKNQIEEVGGEVQLIAAEEIFVDADMICVKQSFENLISNAIKYRHPKRTLLLKIIVEDYGADVCVTFDDNGIGVKPEDAESLFETYFRDSEVQGSIEGHGIGLSTVKTLIEAHGGIIWVDTDQSQGTSFNVQLPKKQ